MNRSAAGGGGGAKSVKRFERSNGLDTALYKNYLFLQAVKTVQKVLKMHRYSIRQREVEMQRQAKLLAQLRQLNGEYREIEAFTPFLN